MEQPKPWKLEDWESTIAQIVGELNQPANHFKRQEFFNNWRAQLQGEQNRLEAFQIDNIMREVQRRLSRKNK